MMSATQEVFHLNQIIATAQQVKVQSCCPYFSNLVILGEDEA